MPELAGAGSGDPAHAERGLRPVAEGAERGQLHDRDQHPGQEGGQRLTPGARLALVPRDEHDGVAVANGEGDDHADDHQQAHGIQERGPARHGGELHEREQAERHHVGRGRAPVSRGPADDRRRDRRLRRWQQLRRRAHHAARAPSEHLGSGADPPPGRGADRGRGAGRAQRLPLLGGGRARRALGRLTLPQPIPALGGAQSWRVRAPAPIIGATGAICASLAPAGGSPRRARAHARQDARQEGVVLMGRLPAYLLAALLAAVAGAPAAWAQGQAYPTASYPYGTQQYAGGYSGYGTGTTYSSYPYYGSSAAAQYGAYPYGQWGSTTAGYNPSTTYGYGPTSQYGYGSGYGDTGSYGYYGYGQPGTAASGYYGYGQPSVPPYGSPFGQPE